MARKNGPTILQEELYPSPGAAPREEVEDARLLTWRRNRNRPSCADKSVSRSGAEPSQKNGATTDLGGRQLYLATDFRCRGSVLVPLRRTVVAFPYRIQRQHRNFGPTKCRTLPNHGSHGRRHWAQYISSSRLADRKSHLEQIPWVESASIMRFVPNRLKVEIHERTPIAFVRIGPRISLIDPTGVVMELPPAGKRKYSFPGHRGNEPWRAPFNSRSSNADLQRSRQRTGFRWCTPLSSLSEVDLTDPDDVKVAIADPSGEVLVHLGGLATF